MGRLSTIRLLQSASLSLLIGWVGCAVAPGSEAPKAMAPPANAEQAANSADKSHAPATGDTPGAGDKPGSAARDGHTATPAAPKPPPNTVRRSREMMGTIIQITVLAPDSPATVKAIDDAFAEMQRLERVLSEWLPGSEISKINQQAGIAPVEVSDDTLAVIQAGLEISRWSDGAFDMSWAALRGMYLFQQGQETVPTRSELDARLPLVDYKSIAVDVKKKTVWLRKKGMVIGTGGIAKGYALDRAGQVLQQAGIDHYMLFGGGQVQVLGMKGDRPWRVGIQHPRRNDYFAYLAVDRGSISTSGDYEHAFMKDGRRWHHLLDLQTGLPVDHTMSVTVLADSGLYADAMSTAVFALGAERAMQRLSSAPGGARFVTVDSHSQVAIGGDLRQQLVFSVQLDAKNTLP